MPYPLVARKHRWPRREHEAIREALIDQEVIQTGVAKTPGRTGQMYRLLPHGSDALDKPSVRAENLISKTSVQDGVPARTFSPRRKGGSSGEKVIAVT